MNKINEKYHVPITNLIRFGSYETREYVINSEKKIIYLNNPKVACTSLKISLFNYNNIFDNNAIHSILRSHYKTYINREQYEDFFYFYLCKKSF